MNLNPVILLNQVGDSGPVCILCSTGRDLDLFVIDVSLSSS